MLLSRWLAEKIVGLSDKFAEARERQMDRALNIAIEAKAHEVQAIIQAKDEQISFLAAQCTELRDLAAKERSRAEAAVDNLLVKSAYPPIANSDLAREAVLKDLAAQAAPSQKETLIAKIFEEVNGVGQDAVDG